MSDRNEFGTFAVGFLVGGLSAAVIALLFAPQSGEKTRAFIKDRSIELRDKAQMTAEEAIARAEAIAADARARADEFARRLILPKQTAAEVEAAGAAEELDRKTIV